VRNATVADAEAADVLGVFGASTVPKAVAAERIAGADRVAAFLVFASGRAVGRTAVAQSGARVDQLAVVITIHPVGRIALLARFHNPIPAARYDRGVDTHPGVIYELARVDGASVCILAVASVETFRAWSPIAEKQGQVERANVAITVDVGRMPGVRTPEAQHQRQIKSPHCPVAIEVPRARYLAGTCDTEA